MVDAKLPRFVVPDLTDFKVTHIFGVSILGTVFMLQLH